MYEVDASGLEVCRFQGRVFEASVRLLPTCGSAVFVRRFMRSRVAVRIDGGAHLVEVMDPASVIAEVNAEYGGRPYGSKTFATEALYWMGYTYRYWCLFTGLSSKAVHGIAGAREMEQLYFPYHTLDPLQSIERILEAKGRPLPKNEEEAIAYGAEVLRRIRSERGE